MRKEEEQRIENIHEWFANHVASMHESTWTDNPATVTLVDFHRPGTGQYFMRFLMCGNKLFVTGDIVNAVFSLTEKADLLSLSKYDTAYLYEKMSCIDDRDKGYDFSSDVALEDIKAYFADKDDWFDEGSAEWKAAERREKRLLSAAADCIGFSDWREAVREEYETYSTISDTEEEGLVSSFGSVFSYGFLAVQEGLRMAARIIYK